MRLFIVILSIITTTHLFAEPMQSKHISALEHLNPVVLMENLDSNKDGRLNYLEAMADSEISDRFLQIDVNNNGFLSLNELTLPKNVDNSQLKILLTFASLQCI
ncbi:hypothetical protein [Neptunomonas sp.]|uniref:hypothetical protein n=1 Tax=Neptunomonas sp. TaxID=1971898 RepID=UPI0025D99EB9|nr:hypothetical protein [Neptunomonas sp.]